MVFSLPRTMTPLNNPQATSAATVAYFHSFGKALFSVTAGSGPPEMPLEVFPLSSHVFRHAAFICFALFFLHSLMDLALFSFCLPLEPWNSPSGEKAIFPDASLHSMNIVRSFHPLFFSSPSVFVWALYSFYCFLSTLDWQWCHT